MDNIVIQDEKNKEELTRTTPPPLPDEQPALPFPFDPFLPGLDCVRGLAVWGNAELYRKALLSFSKKHADDIVLLKAALDRQDFQAGKSLSHSLKGLAGTLSATALAAAATNLDTALASWNTGLPANNTQMLALVAQVELALSTVIHSCSKLVLAEDTPSLPSIRAVTQMDPLGKEHLDNLINALQLGDALRVQGLLVELERSTSIPEATYREIAEQVDEFEFMAAEKIIENLLISLAPSPPTDG